VKAALWGAAVALLLTVVGVLAVFGGAQLAAHSHGIHPAHPPTSPAAAAPVTAAPIPVTQAPPATLVNCGQSESEPTRILFACADGNAGIAGLSWSGWGRPVATASGSVWINRCTPNCAQGTLNRTPGSVTAKDLQAGVYQEITITAPGTLYDGVTEPLR
jgi:hypothetical protein